MAYTRRNVWSLNQPWAPELLWYARGVKVLKSRPFSDITSWRYLAAIHGIDEDVWREFGWLAPGQNQPITPEYLNQDRDQCQHHNWYFIPWHRGYLAAFESIMRAAIQTLPDAPNDWALPYWNYNDTAVANPRLLPEEFAKNTWPDGGDNPLFESRRFGRGDGVVTIREVDVDLTVALRDPDFEGVPNGSPGFGGVRTPFQHNADRPNEGWLEQLPHDVIHGRVGGSRQGLDPRNWKNWGLMMMPESAGLDPIFWLHHANIDRLWEVWLKRNPDFKNPVLKSWLEGPSGKQRFVLPQADGSRKQFSPKDMLDTKAPGLNYLYEDISDPLSGQQRLSLRLASLKVLMDVPGITEGLEVKTLPKKPKVELLGANSKVITLGSAPSATLIRADKPTVRKLAESFKLATFSTRASPEPDRVFLNLENITGENDAAIFDVYVGLAEGEVPAEHPENRAGVVSLFGLSASTNMAKPHGGSGLSKVIEITDMIDRLHLSGQVDLNALPVLFVPINDIGGISIKRVSIYRQST
jgi:tyrosinase